MERPNLERLDAEHFALVVEFLGEPDDQQSESTINRYFTQLYNICWVSRVLCQRFISWFDGRMGIEFPP